jgi:hypothetical protein
MALGATLFAVLLSTPALAKKNKGPEVLERIAATRVADMLRGTSESVEVSTDSYGDPQVIVNRGNGVRYAVYFYNCNDGACTSLQFRTYWSMAGKVDANLVNAYNKDKRPGRAYLDKDGDPTFELNVWLDGGVTPDHVAKQHERFLEGIDLLGKRLPSE